MKNLKYIAIVALVWLGMGSCNFLDVYPRQEMREDVALKDEYGFREALIGVYIRLATSPLYGANMSFYFPDMLAHVWQTRVDTESETDMVRSALYNWDFDDDRLKSALDNTWLEYYRAIAEINNILGNIDRKEDVFTYDFYSLIKGEALGLRAFLHFELLRFFGPAPGSMPGSTITIPYAEQFSKDPSLFTSQTYDTVLAKVLRDLDAAEELLEQSEPMMKAPEDIVDGFQGSRVLRFNYYAVLATKARYYDWIGESALAVEYADAIFKANKFRLNSSSHFESSEGGARNLVSKPEFIFGLHNPQHLTVAERYFMSSPPFLSLEEKDVTKLQEEFVNDIRFIKDRYWRMVGDGDATNYHYLKYVGNEDRGIPNHNLIPVIRLSEMYFILMDNAEMTDPRLMEYFVRYRTAKVLPPELDNQLTDKEKVRSRLEKEYLKEFMGEGQTFYFYKRHKYTTFSWPLDFVIPEGRKNYMIPIPESQSSFD